MKRVALLLAALALAGCETTVIVKGQIEAGERFVGTATATGMFDASGILQLVSDRGLTCIGQYAYPGGKGRATFSCSNGETGTAAITSTGMTTGHGEGTLGARSFSFTWGL